MKVNHNLNT